MTGAETGGARTAAAILLAIVLPPLGVFVDQGITPYFWISLVLTLLFFVPGVLFALFAILGPRLARA